MSVLRQYPRREPSIILVRVPMVLFAFILLTLFALWVKPADAQSPVWECWQTTSSGTPPRQNCVPGLIGVTTSISASGLVVRASPGLVVGAYATNQTATAGFMVLLDATTVPGDGTIAPVDCVPLPANGVASINYTGPVSIHQTGIVIVVTATSCFTKTSTVTSFIRGSALSWP